MKWMQSSPVSSVVDPWQHRDLIYEIQQLFDGIEDSSDIYARDSPLKDKENKLQASLASSIQWKQPN